MPRRTLTARGRVTLFVLAASIGAAVSMALPTDRALRAAQSLQLRAATLLGSLPGESAPNPTAAPGVPASVLTRVPSTRASLDLARSDDRITRHEPGSAEPISHALDPAGSPRFVEWVPSARPASGPPPPGPLRVEYSLDAKLTERVFHVLELARTERGHVVVMDVRSGRVLAYASTDAAALPPQRAYPGASLAKVVTAAAALDHAPARAHRPCLYRGSPYRLTPARVNPTRGGLEASLEKAIAGSYNQCFAQLAVHALGTQAMVAAFRRFGWLESPGPGHEPGRIERVDDDYQLGKLGSGLAGSRITVLHAAQLAASLVDGELIEPWWIDRVVDATGRSLALPAHGVRRRVMSPDTAIELRRMLVRTTTHGTARSAFRSRRGKPRFGDLRVAGKTGNLSGRDPKGRYEWFAGVAPAEDPRVAVAVLQVHGRLWWRSSAQVASDVFAELFCEGVRCRPKHVARFTGDLSSENAPVLLTDGELH